MNMFQLLASLLLVSGLVALGWSRLSGNITPQQPLAPVARPFMTQREQAMLAALEHVLPMYRIHAQVAMGALLKVPGPLRAVGVLFTTDVDCPTGVGGPDALCCPVRQVLVQMQHVFIAGDAVFLNGVLGLFRKHLYDLKPWKRGRLCGWQNPAC